jgi:hypothetical protein
LPCLRCSGHHGPNHGAAHRTAYDLAMPTSRATNIKASAQGQAPRANAVRPTSKSMVSKVGAAKKGGDATKRGAPKLATSKGKGVATNANPVKKAPPKTPLGKAAPAKTPTAKRPTVKASTEKVITAKTAPPKKPSVKTAADRELRRRRFRCALGVTAVVVCGTAGFTAVVFPGFAKAEPPSAPVTAVQIAAPLLARTAQERIGEQTALVAALPDQVGIWVQSGINGYMGWLNDEVVEAWNITYLDGVTAGDGEDEQPIAVRLTVGQWPTPLGSEASKARLFYESQTKGLGGVVMKGNVKVGDATTGQYVIVVDRPDGAEPSGAGEPLGGIDPASIPGDAQGVMWWRNGTVVIKAVGPISVLPDFFSAFPL